MTRDEAQRVRVALLESRARIDEDIARLRQARQERHERARGHLAGQLAEVEVTEAG